MSKVTFPQALHNARKDNGSDSSFTTVGPSLTRQEFAEECDINTLMARFDTAIHGGPGGLPPMDPSYYVDWTTQPQTLLEYMDVMRQAETAFMMLPALVRKEFDNDPAQFVAFAEDPENLPQMRTWGLAPPEQNVAKASTEGHQGDLSRTAPEKVEPANVPPAPVQGAPTHGST